MNYWQARQEVFGGKFVLPMTLGGALRDDLAALEATTYFVLPQADESGRPLLFSVPHSRGGKGLSTQSLVSDILLPCLHLSPCLRLIFNRCI